MEIEETTKHTVEIRNEHVSDQTAAADFAFDNTYARELDGFYVNWKATQVRSPRLVKFNRELAEELGLDGDALDSGRGARIFAGNAKPEGAIPLAQAYAGHQFGGFVRSSVMDARFYSARFDRRGGRRDIQLKGSGPTPFSRAVTGEPRSARSCANIWSARRCRASAFRRPGRWRRCYGREGFSRGRLPGAVYARRRQSHSCWHVSILCQPRRHDGVRRLADYVIVATTRRSRS